MIFSLKELTKLFKRIFVQRSHFQKKMSQAFNSFYNDAFYSTAYLKFCNALYGRNIPQFNLIDSCQWALFLEEVDGIPKGKDDLFLDLGCGMGHNTLEVSKMFQLGGVGIDFSESAVKRAKKLIVDHTSDITFRLGSFHDSSFLEREEKYKIIFSLDGLYGLKDWEGMITLLLSRLDIGGKILIFYSSVLKESDQESSLADSLQGLKKKPIGESFIFHFNDFTQEERRFLERSDKLLDEFKGFFENEGRTNLYKIKKDECKKGLFWHQKKRTKRLFTVIEKVSF